MKSLTHERLVSVLSYSPQTGEFTWKVSTTNSVRAGCRAGRKHRDGYITIGIDNCDYLAHRLAWLYVHGKWPENEIDHINQIRHDNRICNLRNATRSENARNRGMQSNNKSGFKGVCWDKSRNRWAACIRVHGKTIHLGRFSDAAEAHAAYVAASLQIHWPTTKVKANDPPPANTFH